MTARKGDWMQTFTGEKFYPFDPRPEEIHLEDIAHGLALTNRFTGQVPEPYSVAQHSLIVAGYCPEDLKLCGLMHDATEAYLGDLAAPFKRGLKEYQAVEANLWSVIAKRFDLPDPIPVAVMEVDLRLLIDEARSFWPDGRVENWDENLGVRKLGRGLVVPIPWQHVEDTFLKRFAILDRLRKAKAPG